MREWTDEQRSAAAEGYRKAGGSWHENNGMTDPRGPLWRECLLCHRLRTIEQVAVGESDGGGGVRWQCGECEWTGKPDKLYEYQTDLLLNLVEWPDCPPAIRRLLDHCGWLLHHISRGDSAALAESANAARQAVRVLHLFGDWEPWFDDAD
jgi:hypothetical protein